MFIFSKRNIPGGYFYVPAVRHCLLRIDDDVVDYLADLVLVDVARPQVFCQRKFARYSRSAERETRGVLDERRQGRYFLERETALGKGEELKGERPRAVHGGKRCLKVFGGLLILGRGAGQVDVAENAGEQVVEIMRNAAGEDAERVEFLLLVKLVFERLADFIRLPAIGNVFNQEQKVVFRACGKRGERDIEPGGFPERRRAADFPCDGFSACQRTVGAFQKPVAFPG